MIPPASVTKKQFNSIIRNEVSERSLWLLNELLKWEPSMVRDAQIELLLATLWKKPSS